MMPNSHHAELKRLAVLYWLGLSDPQAKDAWTMVEYETNPDPDDHLHELLINDPQTRGRILNFARSRLAFEPVSEEGIEYAKLVLQSEIQKFLNREKSAAAFCSFINHLDAQYVGEFYYPTWLGELWNCCDYCDDTWTLESSPHLAQKALEVLRQLESA
jgi:hypothetical protein